MRIVAIAFMAFTEAVRDRILYSLLAFALAMIGSSIVLVRLSVGGEAKIVKDLGLGAISLVGVLIAVFIGVGLVSREIDRRTIYTIMARPICRAEFILGKFCGLGLTLLVNVAVMTVGLLSLAWLLEGRWSPELLPAVLLAYVELLLLTAAAILFSAFTTPTLSAIFTLSVFVIGRLIGDLRAFAEQFGGAGLRALATGLSYVFPNLARFNISEASVHALPLGTGYIPLALLYGGAYLILFLAAAMAIFARQDLK
ncbi:MAG: ABC transporter permease [candidate division NC10 bacterium]|nr:ABC transporter permease [candidate division NC10 bacterium]